ncbi:MAG: right-handed parallel beta-helix repeat-containing protein, partial [Methanomassiliicoccales archaeon]|nr:right-handed parallel beta-helix repeat-containing protein [Methanomassiliicoccales archaeon]
MLVRGKRLALLLGLVLLLPLAAGTISATTSSGPAIHGLTMSSSAEDATVAWYIDGMFIGGYTGNASFGLYSASDIGLVDHGTIQIDGNAQFLAQATGEGWPGSGTLSDPYLIKGYHILVPPNGTGIQISNVGLFFSIRDCLVEPLDPEAYYNPEAGFNITSSKAVDITSVRTYAMGEGALIVGTDGVSITNCTLAQCGLVGMYVVGSRNVTLASCSFAGAAFGMALESTDNVILRANSFVGAEFAACNCVDAARTTFESNTCVGCALIFAAGVTADTLAIPENNTVNGDPIFFRRGVDFAWETVSGIYGFVYLYNCSNAVIKSLTMDGTTYCVNLEQCKSIFVEDCRLGAGKIPIAFRASDGCSAINDTLASDPFVGTGILVQGAINCSVGQNLVYNCWRGVLLFAASDSGIR